MSNVTALTVVVKIPMTISTDREWISNDDASWILTNAFLVLTMQTGFGLLEAGCASAKNAANIMVKNMVDITLGGIVYWSVGYGLSFGPSNGFCGMGDFFLTANDQMNMGSVYTKYVFQFSFATLATTIFSGAIAGRMKLTAYMMFSVLNTFVYCFPVCWSWNEAGFLKRLGFFDWAGACVVHLSGGVSAFVAAKLLGPRLGRFGPDDQYEMSSPVTALTGTFMLWWAWLGFNCGASFGVVGMRWKAAATAALNTLNGSIGGSLTGLVLSAIIHRGHFDIGYLITSVLGGLVSVTGCCGVITPVVALLVGSLGAFAAIGLSILLEHFAFVDDPVGAIPVHFGSAIVGTLAVGLFTKNDLLNQLDGLRGLFYGGGFYLLSVQIVGIIVITLWSAASTTLFYHLIDKTIGVRVTPEEEILGADWVIHRVRSVDFAHKFELAMRKLKVKDDAVDLLVRKLLAETAEMSTVGEAGGHVRQLSTKEQGESTIARVIQRLYDEERTRCDRHGRALRGILVNSHESYSSDMDQLPGALVVAGVSGRPSTATSVRRLIGDDDSSDSLRKSLSSQGIIINADQLQL